MTPSHATLKSPDLSAPLPEILSGLPVVALSAKTGAGIENLTEAIISKADGLLPAGEEDTVFINARHAHALAHAQECLAEAARKLEAAAPIELLASDLRGALAAFGEISGKIDNEPDGPTGLQLALIQPRILEDGFSVSVFI